MICPHCKKSFKYITNKTDEKTRARALELNKEGYSVRQIDRMLFREGMDMSYSSVNRLIQKELNKSELIRKEKLKAGECDE